jgi:spermidine synthase
MVDLQKFNLIYFRIEDGRKFLVRHITKYDSVVIDSVTGEIERLTWYFLTKLYKRDGKANKRNKKRPFYLNVKRN